MTSIGSAIAELQEAVATIEPVIAGDVDLSKIGLDGDTAQAVNAAIVDFQRRLKLLVGAVAALQALVDDGYPNLANREVSVVTLKVLQDELARIEAALAKFESNEATSVQVTADPPQLK